MRYRKIFTSLIAIAIMAMISVIEPFENSIPNIQDQLPLFSETPLSSGDNNLQNSRAEWTRMRLADPATGKIPVNIRMREMAYARTLPTDAGFMKTPASTWTAMGPYNVGGRTRAAAIDVTNENTLLAGGVSGGLWRSTDSGANWDKVTAPDQHHSITCIVQDTRIGEKNVWYYGSGEAYGNSADYLGNGMYKSIDGGLTWDTLSSTVSGTPQTPDIWDRIWNVAIDPFNPTEDVVLAATNGKIQRSTDGGNTWTTVLGVSGVLSFFSDIAVTSTGKAYATMSSSVGPPTFNNNAANKGIWRSDDGVSWTNITPPGWPATFLRTVIGIDPSDENIIYFLVHICSSSLLDYSLCTPAGQETNVFFGGKEWNGLWKYTYLSGDGSGANGLWQDISTNIPAGGNSFDNFNTQGSYNMMIAVKTDDPNTVFIGGTNLYRSTSGFTNTLNTTQIGGYKPATILPYFELYPNHHPDQHKVMFLPSNPNVMISATDGGVYKTANCMDSSITWISLDNGYLTTQFYTIAIDHGANDSYVVIGGLQDNGSWWTNSIDPTTPWTMPSTGDGSFCAITDGGGYYYFSRQYGRLVKATLDNNGIVTAFNRIDPITDDTIDGGDYLFINPFILDPIDNNVMYLAEGANLWRNDSLSQIPLNNEWDSISTGWTQLTNIVPITSFNESITALACSKSPAHRLYYGTSNKKIFRMDSANVGNPSSVNITNNLTSGGYVSCIAVDPRDADKVMVVFSNYNIYSLFYSKDGGEIWHRVAGNLEEVPPQNNAPYGLGIGDGPSIRWASIIPNGNKTTYLLGTSIGLFSTDTLLLDTTAINITINDSTVWVLQGANTIGNVIVEMIDYRESDGFIALGTHGSGVYTNIGDLTGIGEKFSPIIGGTTLRIYPNPFGEYINIDYVVESENYVVCKIFNTQGKEIARLVDKIQPAGKYSIRWDVQGDRPGNGIYFYKLEVGETIIAGKMVKVR